MRRAVNDSLKCLGFSKESILNCVCPKNHGSSNFRSSSPVRTFWSPMAPPALARTPSPRDASSVPLLGTHPKGQDGSLRLAGEGRGTS